MRANKRRRRALPPRRLANNASIRTCGRRRSNDCYSVGVFLSVHHDTAFVPAPTILVSFREPVRIRVGEGKLAFEGPIDLPAPPMTSALPKSSRGAAPAVLRSINVRTTRRLNCILRRTSTIVDAREVVAEAGFNTPGRSNAGGAPARHEAAAPGPLAAYRRMRWPVSFVGGSNTRCRQNEH
jgi:hypothetical protein